MVSLVIRETSSKSVPMNKVTVDMRMSPSGGKGDHVRVSRIVGELLLDGLLKKEWDVGL